ncbi:hypothetical protein I6A60_26730 [Frankia sp. AgB1.9]|uniref:hypothetical protein n=1 Tax=unclassified Frankia TaxID=2632575 RepID=UPI0019340EC1|nr:MULTISPECIES: hypothetical protein [unclassified Frankia]MBL7551427.1 hypothetical protein [Frankia sp. AgB1.9]
MYGTDERRPTSVIGLGLRFAANLLLVPVIITAVAYWIGDVVTVGTRGQDAVLGLVPRYGLVVALLAVLGTAAVALDRLGLRILTAEAHTLIVQDPRPPILYLRSFGDDAVSVEAAGPSRRGLSGKLTLRRKRPFEEIFAWRVARYGPLIAVNDPRIRLRTLGAAKMHLAMDGWEPRVEAIAAKSLAVMVSAAPATTNQGLLWELQMIAERLAHQRVILVLPPRRKDEAGANWAAFCAVVSGWSFFDGARALNPTGAAHLLVHVPGEGWQAWGAATRTEWTYALAIAGALDHATKAWQRTAPWLAHALQVSIAAHAGLVPATVRAGLRCMYAGVVLTLLNTLVTVPMLARYYDAAAARDAIQNPAYGDLDGSVGMMETSWFIVGGLVTTAAWAWIALRCQRGNNWGRVLALGGCILGTLFVLAKLDLDIRAHSWAGVIDLTTALAGVAGIVLMWVTPSEAHFGSPSRAVPMPQSVWAALRIMYLGMALTLADVVYIGYTRYLGYRDVTEHGSAIVAHEELARLTFKLMLVAIGGLVCEGLWLSSVLGCRRGGGWARVLATVYFGLAALGIVIRLFVETTIGGRLLDLTVLLIAAVALGLLWHKESGRYFRPELGPGFSYPAPSGWSR